MQVRAAAKQHIEVLQRRLADRDTEVAAVKKKMDAMREQFMQRHDAEREEIERLNKALFDRNAKSIADIRNDINKATHHHGSSGGGGGGGGSDDGGSGGGGGGDGVSYEQLQRMLDEREGQLEDIRNKLEQMKSHYEMAANHFQSEQAHKDHHIREIEVRRMGHLRQGGTNAAAM